MHTILTAVDRRQRPLHVHMTREQPDLIISDIQLAPDRCVSAVIATYATPHGPPSVSKSRTLLRPDRRRAA